MLLNGWSFFIKTSKVVFRVILCLCHISCEESDFCHLVYVVFFVFAALRCSRRRVGAVITTELPLLLSKEFSTNHESNAQVEKFSAGFSNSETVDIHRARWAAMFNQMDDVLLQQEKLLVSTYKKTDPFMVS